MLAQLGAVHGDVGAPHQAGAVGGVGRGQGDADAGADAGADHVERRTAPELGVEALGHRRRPSRPVQSTTPSSSPPSAPAGRRRAARQEPAAELAQQLVAGGMAEGVVDLLEAVEVDEQEGQLSLGGPVRLAGRRRSVEDAEELAPVAEPGELVGDGLTVALLGEDAQAADRTSAKRTPTATSVAVASPSATRLTPWKAPTTAGRPGRTSAAHPGRGTPRRSGPAGRRAGRSHSAADMSRIEAGQAMPFRTTPACESPSERPKRLTVSPTTLIAMPEASRNHGPLPRPEQQCAPAHHERQQEQVADGVGEVGGGGRPLPPVACTMRVEGERGAHAPPRRGRPRAPSSQCGGLRRSDLPPQQRHGADVGQGVEAEIEEVGERRRRRCGPAQ